jgi:hypothetical protein
MVWPTSNNSITPMRGTLAASAASSPRHQSLAAGFCSLFVLMGFNLERGIMNNRINQIRKQIRALRVSMLEAEAVMHDRINRDQDCFLGGR